MSEIIQAIMKNLMSKVERDVSEATDRLFSTPPKSIGKVNGVNAYQVWPPIGDTRPKFKKNPNSRKASKVARKARRSK